MTVAFFTEMDSFPKEAITKEYSNMRTEFAWMVALDSDHYNLNDDNISKHYDLGIVINSKAHPEWVNVSKLKTYCDKVAVMQEGPFWYFQDYPLPKQIQYFNNLVDADIIYAHNKSDVEYYKGLVNHKDVRVLRSLMYPNPIKTITHPGNRSGVMIGGNMKSWYGGFDSFMLASSITDKIYQPKMGRREEGEEELGLTQLPYMEWDEWMSELSKRKIGIHMMRTHAAGTFALNCSYLGIPCIGYDGLDTQRILHPSLTVKDGDLNTARKLISRLDNDSDFYTLCRNETFEMYNEHYHESKFKI